VNIQQTLGAYRRQVALGLLWLPLVAWSQAPAASDAQAWRAANAAVGQFQRGHVDVLKWEQAHPSAPAPAASQARGQALAVSGMEDAVRLLWKAQPELGRALSGLDPASRAALATGRWDRIDPAWIRRVEGLREALAATAQLRKDWVSAVSAQLGAEQAVELLGAAQSARELGERMVAVGNWSKMQQAPWQMAEAAARMNLQRTRLAVVQAHSRLLKDLGQVGAFQSVAMAASEEDLPQQTLGVAQVDARAAALHEQLSYAERFSNRDNVFQAYEAYLATHANAAAAADALQLHALVLDETVLHYNGMLKSTWDVLSAAQNKMQATVAAANASRDFEIARIDLDWVLLGGEPAAFVSLGAGDAAAPAVGP
jgi:hypothetical protein